MTVAGPVPRATVAGGGLAGCEAAWQLASRGVEVELWEMRPQVMTPAHTTGELAELVCSNSLGSDELGSASGLLKAELRRLGSLLLSVADEVRVPAGKALAVDRRRFAAGVSERLAEQPGITLVRQELQQLPASGITVIATGPLTSDLLASQVAGFTGEDNLHFFDAVAPIVVADTVDLEHSFWASRYDAGGADYLNCPLDEPEYQALHEALLTGEQHPRHPFEPRQLFEGCLPVEEIARRGRDTLRYGPLKPVGLTDPRTGERAYAVVQLRKEDLEGRLLNLVGFQTNLTFAAQQRAFRLIPALAKAQFVRYGVMHRNTFLRGPAVLLPTLQARARPGLFFAGQLIGVEGYTEAIATGMIAGINAALTATGKQPLDLPREMVLGSLCHYASSWPAPNFQPMNANFGLLPPLPAKVKRRERPATHAARALEALEGLAEHPTFAAQRDLGSAPPAGDC